MKRNRIVSVEGWGTVRVPPGYVLFSEYPLEKRAIDQVRGKRILGRRTLYVIAVRESDVPRDWLCPRCRLVVTGPFLKDRTCSNCE